MSEREAFEAWIQRDLNYGYDLTRDVEGNYTHDATETAWFAWEARAAVQANVPDEQAIRAQLRSALAWGRVYGEVIPAHQWDDMREAQIEQAMAALSAIPKG